MKLIGKVLTAIGAVVLLLTLVSFLPTDFWAIRALDMVREMTIYGSTVLLIVGLVFGGKLRGWISALFGFSALINLYCIWPYSELAATEIELVQPASEDHCFTAMSANVLMDNNDFDAIMDQVRHIDPDVLLLTETNAEWIEQLRPLTSQYPHLREHPQEDTFGKVFASRIAVVASDIIERAGEDTPTVEVLLRATDTDLIRFVGLHPKAPLPGQSTGQRDTSIMRAADATEGSLEGAIVMGDFNDVPWSSTTRAFRKEGDWLDPRVGRGTYPTFPSTLLPAGWPLDQIMVHGKISVADFKVLGHNGSDHRAITGRFCLDRPVNRIGSAAD